MSGENSSFLGGWPDRDKEFLAHCPVCGSEAFEVLYRDLVDHLFRSAGGGWDMQRCSACHSGFLSPRPTPLTIGKAYSNYFTHETTYGSVKPTGLSWIKDGLRNGYLEALHNIRMPSPSWRHFSWLIKLFPGVRAGLDAKQRLVMPHPGARLLDVGCGNGDYLDFARAVGWSVVGVDFDPKAVSKARSRGLNVHDGSVEDLLSENRGTFDAITLSHVIEHVHDPKRLLGNCYDLLKPDGLLWIETPNIDSYGHRIYGRNWRGLEPPRHLALFTSNSLADLLGRAGFDRVSLKPWRPTIVLISQESNRIAVSEAEYRQHDLVGIRHSPFRLSVREAIFSRNRYEGELITLIAQRPKDDARR